MIYIGEQGNIIYDESIISEEQKNKMVAIDVLPEPEVIEGKVAHIKANLDTQEVYYVYEDYVPSQEEEQQEEIEALKQSIAELTMAMTMMMGGM